MTTKPTFTTGQIIAIGVFAIVIALIFLNFLNYQHSSITNTAITITTTTVVRTYCGDGVCQPDETCNTCQKDCSVCPSPVTSRYDAIQRLVQNEKVSTAWNSVAKNANCGASYLDVSNAVILTTRITFSQNLIECIKSNQFDEVNNSYTDQYQRDLFGDLGKCNSSLIGVYNKILRGYEINYLGIKLDEKCFDCDEVYTILLGCVNADFKTQSAKAFAVVDAKTGKVYW